MKKYKSLNEAEKFPFTVFDGDKWIVNKIKIKSENNLKKYNNIIDNIISYESYSPKVFIFNKKFNINFIKPNNLDSSFQYKIFDARFKKDSKTNCRVYYKIINQDLYICIFLKEEKDKEVYHSKHVGKL